MPCRHERHLGAPGVRTHGPIRRGGDHAIEERLHGGAESIGASCLVLEVDYRRWVVDCRAIVFRERYGKDGKSTPLSLKEDLAERDLGAGKPLEIVVKSKE